jgi:hypothetical protein
MAQKYATVPDSSNVVANVPSGSIGPESNPAPSAVTVWASGSPLVQVTSAPGGTSS